MLFGVKQGVMIVVLACMQPPSCLSSSLHHQALVRAHTPVAVIHHGRGQGKESDSLTWHVCEVGLEPRLLHRRGTRWCGERRGTEWLLEKREPARREPERETGGGCR